MLVLQFGTGQYAMAWVHMQCYQKSQIIPKGRGYYFTTVCVHKLA